MSDPAQRTAMARQIVDFEARRDSRGRIQVYTLPASDTGGEFEVAGINNRYHPAKAQRLKDLIGQGKHKEAEDEAIEYIATYTDSTARWTLVPACESYLRDMYFNRGPGGSAKILQMALGAPVDGSVGPTTIGILRKREEDPRSLLKDMRAQREVYERKVVGRDESSELWKGLVNRWDKALTYAESYLDGGPAPEKKPGGFFAFLRRLFGGKK